MHHEEEPMEGCVGRSPHASTMVPPRRLQRRDHMEAEVWSLRLRCDALDRLFAFAHQK
jgi:hypothetical protein